MPLPPTLSTAPTLPTLTTSGRSAQSVPVDALVLAVASTAGPGSAGGTAPLVLGADVLPPQLAQALSPASLTSLGISGRADEVRRLPTHGQLPATVLVLTGVGPLTGAAPAPAALRRAAGAAVRELTGLPRVALALPAADVSQASAVAEGALLGAYAFRRYRSTAAGSSATSGAAGESGSKGPVQDVTLLTPLHRDRTLAGALDRARALAGAVHGVRDLVNTPPNDLYPATFADAARSAAKGLPVTVSVLDEADLAKGGYGGILGVGQGSVRPPRLVKVTYSPRGASRHLALVGKGITFDSGGLSLKPGPSMVTMKCDMAGAAAVLHTVLAAARLKVRVRLTGWLALAENMPSATAQRPSDVLTTYGGRTVEVLNTDAEGRLVMADALVAAGEESPDAIVDIATLTGAQMVALGARTAAVMSSDDALRAQVLAAAERGGEQVWPMPLPEELRASLDSPVADLANIGERNGGMLVAGLFLREFVPTVDGTRVPWAHLDVAGPAFNEKGAHGFTPRGGTGMGVATLLGLAEAYAS